MDKQIVSTQEKILEAKAERYDKMEEIENLKKYVEIKELDRDIVTNLIETIRISEPKVVDGQKCYDVEIRYKFHNKFVSSKNRDFAVKKTVGDN